MTLTELRYIIALAETGHFRKAAEACFVSQPTLSIAVKKLEEKLGVCLFERSRQQVQVTDIGQKVIEQAKITLQQSQIIYDIAEQGKDPLGSQLSVAAIFTVGPYLFPRMVHQLNQIAPNMPLLIEESYTAVLRKKLSAGELDAIIIALPFNEPDVVTQPLYDEPFVVLLPSDHPLAKQKAIPPKSLNEHNVLLLGEGHCFRDQVLEACPGLQNSLAKNSLSNTNRQLHSVVEGSSLETLKHMVSSGLGITVLPESAAELSSLNSELLTIRPFTDPAPQRTVALAWRASYPRHNAIDVLKQAISP